MKKIVSVAMGMFCLGCFTYAQNVGIGTLTPNAGLDINGDIALRSTSLTITGVYNYALNVNTVRQSNYKLLQTGFPPVGNFIIAGITAGADGRVITLTNRSGSSFEMYNDDAGALAANRVITGTGTTFAVYNGGAVTLKYDTASQRWEVISSHFNNLNYFGGNNSQINDTDSDTKVQTEQSPNENIIRFTLAGSEKWAMVGNRLEQKSGNNVLIGQNAGASITYGNALSVAIGTNALATCINEVANTAVGTGALQLTTNEHNTAVGAFALNQNTLGIRNTATGFDAMHNNFNGIYNTASGFQVMLFNTSGNYNVAFGSEALLLNISGNNNTALGDQALYHNTSGINNVALGYHSLFTNTIGKWNTSLGDNSNTSANNLEGATALGTSAISNASNKIVLGANIAGMVIGGYANWSNLSDGRFKNNVNENVPGLNFIKQLRPVTYTIDIDKLQHHITAQMPDSIAKLYYPATCDIQKANTEIKTGFIAQEVEAIVKRSGYQFDGVNAPKNPTDNYSIAYSQFVVPLVKAVQEQQAMIEKLQQENERLVRRIEKLEKK